MRKIAVLRKHRPRDAVELARGGQVAAERLLDDDARVVRQARRAEPLDDRREERRRNGEVVRRAAGIAERLLERREGRRIVVVAAARTGAARADGGGPARRRSGPPCVMLSAARLRSSLQTPWRGGDADHRERRGRPASPSRRAPGRSSCGRGRPSRRRARERPNEARSYGFPSERLIHDFLRLRDDAAQVALPAKTLGVDLVDILGARGRAANQPLSAMTFTPPIGASLPGAWLRMCRTFSPARSVQCTSFGESAASRFFCSGGRGRLDPVVDRLAELARQLAVDLAGIAARAAP